jgi:hypothetical protein
MKPWQCPKEITYNVSHQHQECLNLTLNRCYSLRVRNKILHSYKTICKIIIVVLCVVFHLIVVLFCVMRVICLLCLIVLPLPLGKNPFAVKINNNNNNNLIYMFPDRRQEDKRLWEPPIVKRALPNRSSHWVAHHLATASGKRIKGRPLVTKTMNGGWRLESMPCSTP